MSFELSWARDSCDPLKIAKHSCMSAHKKGYAGNLNFLNLAFVKCHIDIEKQIMIRAKLFMTNNWKWELNVKQFHCKFVHKGESLWWAWEFSDSAEIVDPNWKDCGNNRENRKVIIG